ncbi:ChAPs family protein [Rhizoctonia solani AG-1 IA]|uniref:ChAPs family protein n=1 Tax=Thanatephorus cucumeris (strain AG1-IA) TaxID=983506 RepID=L8X3W0_THACA|nr:ChAPs family protein [Rhizoctonia solani AG-1 IA]
MLGPFKELKPSDSDRLCCPRNRSFATTTTPTTTSIGRTSVDAHPWAEPPKSCPRRLFGCHLDHRGSVRSTSMYASGGIMHMNAVDWRGLGFAQSGVLHSKVEISTAPVISAGRSSPPNLCPPPAMDAFRDIPEFFEPGLASFRELGPPDLCHVVKTTGRAGQRDTLAGLQRAHHGSFALGPTGQSITSSAHPKLISRVSNCDSCYNAFSRLDVRVDVKIPGGVQAYCIDLRGDRHEATPAIWQETYLSALLRAIHYADDPNYRLAGYRKLDPITTPEGEVTVGWQLGSDPEIQVASPVSNHLTSGILKYFGAAGRYAPAVNFFERMYVREPEVASLLATSYIGMIPDEEIKALQTLSAALASSRPDPRASISTPPSYTLLHVQCDLVRSKGKKDWAVALARQAVNVAPSEFLTWAKLTECYIENGQYESALLTLNSCPMFTYNERDLHRMPTPARTHLPVREFIKDSGILDEDSADIALLRLPAPSLRGTFAKAYALLTRLASEVGWDELLRKRSAVFVMEEEYRSVKMRNAEQNGEPIIHEDGTITHGRPADDNASTRGMRRSPSPGALSNLSTDEVEFAVPTIKVTHEEDESQANGVPTIKVSEHNDEGAGEEKEASGFSGAAEGLEKPVSITVSTEEAEHKENGALNEPGSVPPKPDETMSFSTKRLCERWLDNLFMVLYETQRVAYKKTGTEWEILGDLGARLHHKEDAKEAYTRCLEQKFSAKAWMRLLEIYADEGDLQRGLNAHHTRPCKSLIHAHEYGPPRRCLINYAGIPQLWAYIQTRG